MVVVPLVQAANTHVEVGECFDPLVGGGQVVALRLLIAADIPDPPAGSSPQLPDRSSPDCGPPGWAFHHATHPAGTAAQNAWKRPRRSPHPPAFSGTAKYTIQMLLVVSLRKEDGVPMGGRKRTPCSRNTLLIWHGQSGT